nr:hypothetical protein [Bacteroidota bacterium]
MKNKLYIFKFLCVALICLSHLCEAQVPIPFTQPVIVAGVTWNTWQLHTININTANKIVAPGTGGGAVAIIDNARVDFTSSTEVHLTDGFHAGHFNLSGNTSGRFHAGIFDNPEVVMLDNDYTTIGSDGLVHIPKWEKLEIGIKLPSDYKTAIDNFFAHYYNGTLDANKDLNPYANDSLELEIQFTSPTGIELTRYGFFMRMGHWVNTNQSNTFSGSALTGFDDVLEDDATNPLNDYSIRFRFAPNEESALPWTFKIIVKAPHTKNNNFVTLQEIKLDGFQFICDPALPDNKGFLSVNPNNKRYLKFDNGEPFFGLGLCNADTRKFNDETTPLINPPNVTYRYMQMRDHDLRKEAMTELNFNGANWMRTMNLKETYEFEYEYLGVYDKFENSRLTCDEGFAVYDCIASIETYVNSQWNVTEHSHRYGNRQAHAWAFDDLLDKAREQNIYLQHCIDYYHVLTDYQNFQWGDQCYYNAFVKPTFNPTVAPYIEPKKYFAR